MEGVWVKYFYWILLVLGINTLIIFSRTGELSLSFEIGVCVTVATTVLWHYFDKFWKTYEEYKKKLDTELE